MRRLLHIISAWCLLITPGFAEQTGDALSDAEASALIAALSFPADVEVAFEQTQLNPLFKRISRQQGVMLKSAEQGLVMRVIQPRPEQRVLHQGSVTLTRQVRNKHTSGYRQVTRRMQLDPDRASHLMLFALEAFLQGQPVQLYEHFEVLAVRDGSSWSIKLLPLDDELSGQVSRLWFRGQNNQLQQFRSERDNGAGGYSHFLEVDLDSSKHSAEANQPS